MIPTIDHERLAQVHRKGPLLWRVATPSDRDVYQLRITNAERTMAWTQQNSWEPHLPMNHVPVAAELDAITALKDMAAAHTWLVAHLNSAIADLEVTDANLQSA